MIDADEIDAPAPAFLTDNQTAVFLNLTPHELYLMRRRGDGPPFVMFGARVRYPIEGLQGWAQNRPRFTSRAEAYVADPKRARAATRQRAATVRARKTRWTSKSPELSEADTE
jgi:hypothetical protein